MKAYDVIVIGGGAIGIAVSYFLSKEGMRVALIERGDLACGSSSKCDGNILLSARKPGIDTKIVDISQQLFKVIVREVSDEFEYTQRGSMYLIENEEEWEIAKNHVSAHAKNGYSMQMLNKQDIHYEEPFLAEDVFGGFIELNHDASINPMKYVYSVSREAAKNGVELFTFCSVIDINLNKEGAVESVITDKGILLTKNVVNCAGVWAPKIGKMVDIEIPILPRKGQLLVSEKTFPVGKRKITEFGYVAVKSGNKNYSRQVSPEIEKLGIAFVFEPTLSNNFIIGSSRSFEGYDTNVSIDVIKGLAARAIHFFPIMKEINVIHTYAGLRPYVPDNFPIISAVDEIPGFYIAAGHEGSGVALSPITGKLITQLILEEEPIIPLEKYSFSRFKRSACNNLCKNL